MNKPKYKPLYSARAYNICKLSNYNNTWLAKYFRVSDGTIRNWRKRFDDFNKAVIDGQKEYWNF